MRIEVRLTKDNGPTEIFSSTILVPTMPVDVARSQAVSHVAEWSALETKFAAEASKQAELHRLVLNSTGPNRIDVIRLLRETYNLSLKGAKDISYDEPTILEETTNLQKLILDHAAFKEAGASVSMFKIDVPSSRFNTAATCGR